MTCTSSYCDTMSILGFMVFYIVFVLVCCYCIIYDRTNIKLPFFLFYLYLLVWVTSIIISTYVITSCTDKTFLERCITGNIFFFVFLILAFISCIGFVYRWSHKNINGERDNILTI